MGWGSTRRLRGLSVGSKKGAENAKGRGRAALTRGMENDPYCIRKKILRVEVQHPSGASGSVDSLLEVDVEVVILEVDVEIVLFGVKRFFSKILIKRGIRCSPQDRFHENSSTLTHR
jgi:hypothetical protein